MERWGSRRRSSGTGVTVGLTDGERTALVNLLTVETEASKFPLSPRIEELKRIRAKLRGEGATPQPPERPVATRGWGLRR